MMKLIPAWAAVLPLALPATALAESFESFGNAPLGQRPNWPEGALGVVNLEGRVYSLWQGQAKIPTFFYQGDGRALNEAIRKFAAVKAGQRRLVLLPGRGQTRSFGGKRIDFDWRLHLPLGGGAEMTAYVNALRPRGPLDRKTAEKWLRDLDDESFEARRTASRGLEKLGVAAKPLLREALRGRPSVEARRRAERLLAKLQGVDAGDLEIPAGVQVVIEGNKDEPGPAKEVKKRLAIFKDLEELKKARGN
jgi:hypothetical protein